jgi:hypothetical protein
LIDKGAQAATVQLHLPTTGTATVQRLLAPAASSDTHLTLAGQRLSGTVRWRGKRVIQEVASQSGRYSVRISGLSATLLTVRVAPTTLVGSSTR